jgi:putative DNA primase/helicase
MKAPRREIPFKRIADRALHSAKYIVQEVAPGGRIVGAEYKALNPRRNDQAIGSFSINLNTGFWADFATGDKGGDLVSYVAFCNRSSQGEAALWLANRLGMRV